MQISVNEVDAERERTTLAHETRFADKPLSEEEKLSCSSIDLLMALFKSQERKA